MHRWMFNRRGGSRRLFGKDGEQRTICDKKKNSADVQTEGFDRASPTTEASTNLVKRRSSHDLKQGSNTSMQEIALDRQVASLGAGNVANKHKRGNVEMFDGGEAPSNSKKMLMESDSRRPSHKPDVYMRKWDYTAFGHKHLHRRQPGMEFMIMSYNVLAQRLLEDHLELYRHCHTDFLQWDYRRANLAAEIRTVQPDILCMQEVQSDHYVSFWMPMLEKLGYSGAYKQRTGDKCDGCATFYRTDVFQLEARRDVEYLRVGATLLDRDNVALVVVLRPRAASVATRRLCVANTHLLYNPRRGDVKLAQLSVLLAEVDRLAAAARGRRCAVVLCGDFNMQPFCDLYRFLCGGRLRYGGLHSSQMSGQTHKRTSSVMRTQLLPETVGISEQCQYVASLPARDASAPTATRDASAPTATRDTRAPTATRDGSVPTETRDRRAVKDASAPWGRDSRAAAAAADSDSYDSDATLKDSDTSSVSASCDLSRSSDSDAYLSATSGSTLGASSAYMTAAGSLASLTSSEMYFSAAEPPDSDPSASDPETSPASAKSRSPTKESSAPPCGPGAAALMPPPPAAAARVVTYETGHVSHALELVSVYRHLFPNNEPEVSTSHDDQHMCVDFAFYGVRGKRTFFDRFGRFRVCDVREGALRLVGRMRLLTAMEIRELGCLPNKSMSSDHLWVGAKFLLADEEDEDDDLG
ncbi:PREDICTED: protein angel homolog 2-like [Priapulus caudatus]|uniref:Protein angel homolog 2-like n=1 Tax=Priapulus caudatus TaxID=37621 RepID=A0ABM1E6K6_PRICU|nr:PREDICTED: protein angel homolog 2-like [Priapulus caudatus]